MSEAEANRVVETADVCAKAIAAHRLMGAVPGKRYAGTVPLEHSRTEAADHWTLQPLLCESSAGFASG